MASTLYTNAIIITVDEERRVIRNGYILVNGNCIRSIGDSSQSPPVTAALHHVDLERKLVIPGLINGHVHLIQSLMKGLAEDLELHSWASCAIWPMEASYSTADGHVAALLAMTEMLKSGTTCFLEPMLPASAGFEGVAEAVGMTGIRACLGKLVKGTSSDPAAGILDARDRQADQMSIASALEAREKHHGAFEDRLHVWMATETPRGQDESGFAAIGKVCKDHDIRLTMHLSEAPKDYQMIRQHYRASPVQFAERVHAVGPHVVLGHMTCLDLDTDLEILARTGTHIAHNPTSNAKLCDGIAPIPHIMAKGINVCLGTDGAPCNNGSDIFRDMHLAGVIHKATTHEHTTTPSEQILEMATINAAKALGLDKDVGSLEVGKKADFVVLDHSKIHTAPFDPDQVGCGGIHPSTLVVHSLSGRDVDMVVVDGRTLVQDGKFTGIDECKVYYMARKAIVGIRNRSGIAAQPMKMNWIYR